MNQTELGKKHLQHINDYLSEALNRFGETASRRFTPLVDAMRYSLEGGGKRLRPSLVLSSAHYLGIDPKNVLPAAAAIEFIHTYSLVHDDLPAIDDDDERRGKASNHKKFGEAVAILAGDALCTEAFGQMLSLNAHFPAENVLKAIGLLVHHSGVAGMVGGQYLDVTAETSEANLPELEFIHIHKTGALILTATLLPAFLSGLSEEKMGALKLYGEAIGLAFQISDDLLDAESGHRYSRGPRKKAKPSYVQLMAPTEARARLNNLIDRALDSIRGDGEKATLLIEIAEFIRTREH